MNANSDMALIDISLETSSSQPVDHSPHDQADFIIQMHSKIIANYYPEDKADAQRIELGEIDFQLLRVSNAIEAGWPLDGFFDYSQELCELYSVLYDDDDYHPKLHQLTDTLYNVYDDILFIEKLALKLFARGQKIGHNALKAIERGWSSGCCLIATLPLPLQFTNFTEQENEQSYHYE